jgi:hypothetical protein
MGLDDADFEKGKLVYIKFVFEAYIFLRRYLRNQTSIQAWLVLMSF